MSGNNEDDFFSDGDEARGHEYEILSQIAELCTELGWDVMLPTNEEIVPGLVIGNEDFLAEMGNTYEKALVKFKELEKLH
jgi:hypothetical protein